jgi:hypothetical protein
MHRQEAASKASKTSSESKLEKMSTFGSFASSTAENDGAMAISAGPTVAQLLLVSLFPFVMVIVLDRISFRRP